MTTNDARARAARLELARRKFEHFIPLIEPSYQTGWAQRLIQRKLQKFIKDVQEQKSPRLMICLPPRHPLADDTPILTTRGWTVHGLLRPGDYVYHPSGKPTRVVAVSEPTEMTHELTIGVEKIVAGPFHKWRILGSKGNPRIVDTLELVDILDEQVMLPRVEDVEQAVELDDPRPFEDAYETGRRLRESFGRSVTGVAPFPERVLESDLASRREFFAGLFERGRSRAEPGACSIATADEQVLWGIIRLVRSLGLAMYMCASNNVSRLYRLRVRADEHIPFRTFAAPPKCRKYLRKITEVKPLPKDKVVMGRCIEVEAEDGLYLCGQTLIPTHNSKSLTVSQLLPMWALGVDPTLEFVVASYGLSLPAKFSRRVRATLRDDTLYHEIFPDTRLHPDNQSVEDWETTLQGGYRPVGRGGALTGKGAHCLDPTTPIIKLSTTSPKGYDIITASRVQVGDYIYGYDHQEDRPKWTRVLAVSATRGKRAECRLGALCTTADHRFFTHDRGYVPRTQLTDHDSYTVCGLSKGVPHVSRGVDKIKACWATLEWQAVLLSGMSQGEHTVKQMDVPEVWREKVFPREQVPGLRAQGAGEQALRGRVRAVWEAVYQAAVRACEVIKAWAQAPFLFLGVFAGSRTGSSTPVRGVWSKAAQKAEALLLPGVLQGVPGEEACCGQGVRGGFLPEEGSSSGARRLEVCAVRQRGVAGGPPHRPRQAQTHYGESGDTVQGLPPEVSCTPGATAESLSGGSGLDYVVDLQTRTGNFFAAGVLVHNCLIIDDLLKDASEADSPVIRESAIDWYSSTAYTRLYPGAGVIIVMTRWHVEDLAGVELDKMDKARIARERGTLVDDHIDPDDVDQWDLVSLPALAETYEYLSPGGDDLYQGDDPPPGYSLIRKPGDALHRERYDERALARIKATLLPRHWVALYQQSPLPEDGAFFELEQFMYGPLPDLNDCMLVIAADTAASTEQSADESCIMLGAMDQARNIRIVEAVVGRYNVYAFCELLLDMYMRYPDAVVVGIESGPLREAIMPVLEQVMRERDIYPPLADKAEMRPSVSKEVRARPVQGLLQAGRLWLPRHDPQNPPPAWVQKLLHQMRLFPQSSEDDMVDTLAWLVRLLLARGTRPVRRRVKKEPSWRDKLRSLSRPTKTFMGA